MSKITKLTKRSVTGPMGLNECAFIAESILIGKRPVSTTEAKKLFEDAADDLELQFNRLDHNFIALAEAELQASEKAKKLISTSKDLFAKVGDAMARIDKVIVKDFEQKLCHLERFVEAMNQLNDLNKSGSLDKILLSFIGNKYE